MPYKLPMHALIACLIPLLAGLNSLACFADDTAKRLFDQSAPMVFQVKVIDKGSGNKSTIGSGFQVTPSGVIATNYHVVSKYVLDKELHSIEVLDHNDMPIEASLINFDVVHDLALLQLEQTPEPSFTLNLEPLSQGTRIYSMGNPHDLGMTIIEGNYNGLVEGSRYQKYLFSGSLNGGMSGGPVLDNKGEIIGVNVSKGGEQLSFLVPVKHLNNLMAEGYTPIDSKQFKAHTLNSLVDDQNQYYKALLGLDWQTKAFQQFELPDKIHESLKCWGHTLDKKDNHFDETHRHCRTEDRIYLKAGFYTGNFAFNYEHISSEQLNTPQFNYLLEDNYALQAFSNGNNKEDTTNFECLTHFVNMDQRSNTDTHPWKVTTCIREYIDYPGLYDTGLIAMYADSSSDDKNAIKIAVRAAGINQENIAGLHSKFLGSVKWQQ